MTDSQNLEFTADPDYGIWTRAVERAVDIVMMESEDGLDWWPSENLVERIVAQATEELGHPAHPDNENDMEYVEDLLIDELNDN